MDHAPLEERRSLEFRLFGGFEIRKATKPIPRTRTRSGEWLLALLALRHDREVERGWLAGILWPDSAESQALYNVRRSLSDLRRVLGEDACRLVSPTSHSVALDTSHAFVDVVAFERAIAQGDPASLQEAVGLYRGPLLEGCLEEWVLPEQQRYEQAYLTALERLASQATAQQNHSAAIEYLRKALACDPMREATLQALMLSLTESGDMMGALAAYRQFRLRLHNELQAEPDSETVAIYRRLRTTNGKKRPLASSASSPEKPAALHYLPHPLTPLIGRETEITQIAHCLRETRLVTLMGTGGVGKTRLAIAVAHQVARDYADGVWFLDLAALTDPSQLTHTVAALLEAQGEQEGEAIPRLCRSLDGKSLLLILDNCEHLVQACAELAETVLRGCPKVRILATSQQALGIYGEQSWRVPCLSLPENSPMSGYPRLTDEALLAQFVQSDAVRLFVEGAIAANRTFRLTPENSPHVAKICCLLEGIPFAIELASAWVKSLPVAQIAERLDNCFEFLIGGSRTARPQQQTLRAALDWSYQLLSDAEKTLLCRLSVFSGGWTLEAAEAVCGDVGQAGVVLPLLTQLMDKSLVVYEEQQGRARYRLLETTYLYAKEQRSPAERTEGCRRHAHFFLQLAQQAQEERDRLGRASAWQVRVREEQDNLRAALAWWRNEDIAAGAWILQLLYYSGLLSYHSQEARDWIARLHEGDLPCAPLFAALYREVGAWANWLGYAPEALHLWEKSLETATLCADKPTMAAALLNLGCDAMNSAAHERAETYLQASQACFEELGEACQGAKARNRRGLLAFYRGDMVKARQLLEKSLETGREQDNKSMIADALDVLGYVSWQHQEHADARTSYEELVALLRSDRDRFTANALRHLGAVEGAQGDFSSAWRHLEEARAINRQIGFLPGEGWDRCYMADLAFEQGDYEAAWTHLADSLRIFDELGEVRSGANCLRRWAQYETRVAQWERAVCLWSYTQRLFDCYQWPLLAPQRVEFDTSLALCRAQLPSAKFQAAWTQGQTLPTEQAGKVSLLPVLSWLLFRDVTQA